MYTEDFSPFGVSHVKVEFTCDVCNNYVVSDYISIPSPDYSSETASDSYEENFDSAFCGECGKQFDISIYSGYAGGYFEIDEIDQESSVESSFVDEDKEYELDAILSNTLYYDNFNKGIENIKKLNMVNMQSEDLNKYHKRLLYTGVVTCLETYLSDAFINITLSNKGFLKKFIETFPSFKTKKFELKDLWETTVEDIAKKAMLDVTFHNIITVSNMYRDTLGIKFTPPDDLIKAILKRHDLVHRNGRSKDNKEILIDKDGVDKFVLLVENFVYDLDVKIREVENKLREKEVQ